MIDLIELNEWKTKKEILTQLKNVGVNLNEREWRRYVERYNKQFCLGVNEDYIAHSSKGYKLTKDKEEIKQSVRDYRARALNMLKKTSDVSKVLKLEKPNLFELEE